MKAFDWQEGYGAFSVSASQLESVVNIFTASTPLEYVTLGLKSGFSRLKPRKIPEKSEGNS